MRARLRHFAFLIGAISAAASGVCAFVLEQDWALERSPSEASVLRGAMFALLIAGAHFTLRPLFRHADRSLSLRLFEAALLGIFMFAIQAVMHHFTLRAAFAWGMPVAEGLHAAFTAALAMGYVTWLAIPAIARDPLASGSAYHALTRTPLFAVAFVCAAIAILPILATRNSLVREDELSLLSRIGALTERELSISQSIGRFSHIANDRELAALRGAVRDAEAVGAIIEGFEQPYPFSDLLNPAQGRALPGGVGYSAYRRLYVEAARTFIQAPQQDRPRRARELEAAIDSFQANIRKATDAIQTAQIQLAREVEAVRTLRLTGLPLMMIGFSLALLWPLTRFVFGQAQQLHDESQSRLKAMEEIREQKTLLANVSELVSIGGWHFDAATRAVGWTEGTRCLYAVKDDFVPDEESSLSFFEPEGRARISAAIRNCLAWREAFDFELPARTAQGKKLWVRIIGRPEASAGKVTGVTGALHDITDLYEKHATLMSALKDTSIALDNMGALHEVLDSHACLTMTDRRGDFTFVNDKFCDIAGFSREELIGQNYRILKSGTHEDAFFEEFWESISGGKTWRGAICNRRRNGEIFWADTTVVPLRGADGRPDRFVSIHHDITDQIHASKKRSFQARITEGIAAIQAAFIEKTLPDAFRTALDHINALTESEYGFIGEVLFDRDGQPFIHTHAITNIAWDEASRAIYAQFKSEGPIFRNLKTLFGAALLSEEPVIANDAPHDERSGGLPKGHPPLNSFLGIPIKALGRLVCMVGVANRPGGYDEALIGDLERLFSTLGQLVLSKRDRDAREASEAALARERQRLADIIDGTRAGTWEWDLRSGALQVNERWAEIVGYRQGDLVAHIDTWTALCHPDDLALSRALIHEHLSGSLPHYECEVRMRHRDGHWVWVLDRGRVASRDADGTALTMSGTQLDVSVRKNADEAVKAALREVSGFFDVSLDLLCILGLDGRIIKANQNFEPVLGYKSGELEGRNLFMVMHPDDRKEAFQIALKIIEGTEPQRFVNCCVHKDGRNLQLEWCAQLLNGRIYVAGRDITARLAYEEEIEKKRIEAEAASIAKGQFLATMSHEIRTPLNGVIGMLDLVRDKGLSAQQLPLVRDAHNAAENLLTLLNDILDFSKLESGNVPIEKLPVRVRRIVSEVCAIHSPSAQKKNIALGVEIDADVPEWVESDPTRLRQILSNLVSNAVKFTEKGHITLKGTYDPGSPLGTLRFSVRDTGLGISPDIQAKLFNRFMQADASTTRRYGGTGLGLAICKELVHLMGGEIGIESEAGKGSEFWFTLPVPMLGEVRAEEGASLAPPVMPRAGLRILVVEDNALNQKIVAAYCDRIGLLHAVASTGMEAIAAVQREAYDAILMDVNLPEMDGLAATRAIRQLPGSASTIPIIALTANAMDGDREKFLQAGMDAYLPKPIDPQLLYATLATVTGGPRAPGPAVVPDHPSERLALTSPSPIKDDEIAALIADLDRIDARRRQSA